MTKLTLIPALLLVGLSSAFVFQQSNFATFRTTQSKPTFLAASTADKNADVNTVLETLEKRLKEGDLTDEEKKAAIAASESLLDHLDELESAPKYDASQLRTAVSELDIDAVSNMLKAGLEMDEETTDVAFWAAINAIDTAEAQDLPFSANVTQMIHHVFDADHRHLLTREQQKTNLTCMQPDDSDGVAGTARAMNYVFDDGDHKNLPLMEGRRCEDGTCCDECSRNIFPTFATDAESNDETFPKLNSLTFNDLEKISSATIVQFVRLVERVRRTIAHEYGLPLKTILPLQAYSRKYVAGTTQKGGGGGEGDFVILHTDEATHAGYHYSCVLYLSTQGEDFEGGNFIFNDPDPAAEKTSANVQEVSDDDDEISEDLQALFEALQRGEELPDLENIVQGTQDVKASAEFEEDVRKAGRVLTPFSPTRGAAVIFSSGWENMHEVEKITSGVRYAVPCFFTTCPVPDAHYDIMKVGKPKSNEDIAEDWLHLLLAHQKEEPIYSAGRVKELMMKWHYMCAPLSEH